MGLEEIKRGEGMIEIPPTAEVLPPAEEVYSTETLPRTPLQEKFLKGEQLPLSEAIKFGRDKVFSGEIGEGISTKPDRAYRGVDLETLKKYYKEGGVEMIAEGDEFVAGKNNAGVDWYLGGFASKYGEYVLEAMAKKDTFEVLPPGMASDPLVRHLKSKGGKNGVPFSAIERILKLEKEDGEAGRPPKVSIKNFDIAEVGKMVEAEGAEADQKKLAEVRASLGL